MFNETLSEAGEEPPSSFVLNSLKQLEAPPSFWANVADQDWNDWRWQLKNRLRRSPNSNG